MAISTIASLRLLTISCWLIAGCAGSPIYESNLREEVPLCNIDDRFECIPQKLTYHLGRPMSRAKINSSFKMKSRLKENDNPSKRSSSDPDLDDNAKTVPMFTNTVEILGNPNNTWYDISEADFFDPALKVVIIIHGWAVMNGKVTRKYNGLDVETVNMPDWVAQLQLAVLQNDAVNAIVHDWRGGALHGYSTSRYNTWTAGKDLALFIKSLFKEGTKPSQIHLIGHSLGCHVASIAAKSINTEYAKKIDPTTGRKYGKISRISAMDPAQPLYETSPSTVRLVKFDTKFLDVYHTDGTSFTLKAAGILAPIGHVDFYPNNGTDQPHCHQDFSMNQAEASVCDHLAAYVYFIASITRQQLAIKCKSYEDFINGECYSCRHNTCMNVGYFADKPLYSESRQRVKSKQYGSYYYQTSTDSDFCAKSIMVEVQFSKRMVNEIKNGKFGLGNKLTFRLEGETGEIYELDHDKDIDDLIKGLPRAFEDNRIVKHVFGLPCSNSAFPVRKFTLSVKTECKKRHAFLRSFISGSCGNSDLHVRRARIREISAIPQVQRLLPIKRDKTERSIIFAPSSITV